MEHEPNCNIREKLSDVCSCRVMRDPLVQAYMDRDGMTEAEASEVAAAVRGVLAG